MKLLGKDIHPRDKSGTINFRPEEHEDLWHIYNLIRVHDSITATTVRRITTESSTGSSASQRIKTILTIEVDKIEYNPGAETLRINGRNIKENKLVKMGAFHTIDLELNRSFKLGKSYWDTISLERVEEACDPSKSAEIGAVIMAEGLANVCLVTDSMTILRSKVETTIPRKRRGSVSAHDKSMKRFFENVLQAILRHFDFSVLKGIIVASPGFVKDQFFDYMCAEAVRRDIKVVTENKSKFLLCHTSTGHKYSLKEVFDDPNVLKKLSNTKAAGEVRALALFYEMLNNDPDRAVYGYGHTAYANEQMAIQTLMVADSLFRSDALSTREKYVKLIEAVRTNGGEVKIFSTLHVSGEQLSQLSGVAAILRFPIPDIDDHVLGCGDDDDDDDDSSDSDSD
eukprot:TRINITY_DN1496_c1_g4_i1.p1 TRINITY_DN1496_c1_g4~~TRINITY_DN1496_c1_g4_i1.p1  ORF type:complete len:440 (+),score=100.63 TRINITY_DN1496_c1_g4_i1:128-1321(+)